MADADTFLATALFAEVLSQAIDEVRNRGTPVYTFAFYHDHESAAVSVCVDTEANSLRSVAKSNAHSLRYFVEAMDAGDLKAAALWKANVGRNLSLGDFALVNVARTALDRITPVKGFHLGMVRALWERRQHVAALSPAPDRLLFCCSSAREEVEYMWSLGPSSSS
jgi:hypothetical protein